jgi:hypothetical protein
MSSVTGGYALDSTCSARGAEADVWNDYETGEIQNTKVWPWNDTFVAGVPWYCTPSLEYEMVAGDKPSSVLQFVKLETEQKPSALIDWRRDSGELQKTRTGLGIIAENTNGTRES